MTTLDDSVARPIESADHPSVAARDVPADPPNERSLLTRHGISQLDVLVMFAIVLITCAYTPFFFTWFWAPRAIVLLGLLPVGLVALASLVRRRDAVAIATSAVLAWATISAVFSGGFLAAFRGFIGQDVSVMFWAASFGLYALGRRMSDAGRRVVPTLMLWIFGLHALVGVLQMLFQIEASNLGLLYGRSIGLTINPVYFGGYMAMASVLCFDQLDTAASSVRIRTTMGLALLFGVAVSFSGSRVALGAVVVVGCCLIIGRRSRRSALGACLWGLGVAVGSVAARVVGADRDSASRLAETNSGGRFTMWRAGLDALTERPIFGWGLGRFRTAIQGELPFEYVAGLQQQQNTQWDAHNLIVGIAVALGVPGLLLVGLLVVRLVQSSRGPLAITAAAVAITWMLQPAALVTFPVVLALLGVAYSGSVSPGPAPVGHAVWWCAAVAGLVVGGFLATAEFRMSQAVLAGDVPAVDAAAGMYWRDPIAASVAATSLSTAAIFDETFEARAAERVRQSVEYESTRPLWWTELANLQGSNGDLDAALRSARRALALQPTDPTAWQIVRQVGLDRGDDDLVAEADDALCRLGAEHLC